MNAIMALLIFVSANLTPQATDMTVVVYGGVVDDLVLHDRRMTEDSKRIYINEGDSSRVIWKGDRVINRVKISPNGMYVAFITEDEIQNAQTLNLVHAFHLMVVERTGKLVKDLEDGVRYSWGPNGSQIVYIRAVRIEEKMGYEPTGTAIYDVQKDMLTNLDFKTYDLDWASFDSLVYYLDYSTGKVKSFNPETRVSAITDYKGICFSPDGEFYYRPNYEGGGFALYSKDNIDLTKMLLKGADINYPSHPQWINAHALLLRNQKISTSGKTTNVIYDPKGNRISRIEGKTVGSVNNRTYIGMLSAGRSIVPKKVPQQY
jgi:hypothetical protein